MVEEGTQPATLYFLTQKTSQCPLRQREDVHRAAFGHFRILTGEEAIESVVHAARIAAPSAVHGQVLLAVDRERAGGATMPDVVTNSQSSLPLAASNA